MLCTTTALRYSLSKWQQCMSTMLLWIVTGSTRTRPRRHMRPLSPPIIWNPSETVSSPAVL